MRILFDEGTPAPLRESLGRHTVDTAFEQGRSSLRNGDLLDMAEAEGFEVLVTTDQRLRYQQNLANRKIAILVLTTTSWPRIQQQMSAVIGAIDSLTAGEYRELPFAR